jgi:hypothetical protein
VRWCIGSTAQQRDTSARRLDTMHHGTMVGRREALDSMIALRHDGMTMQQLDGAAARQNDAITARRHDSATARGREAATVRQLGSATEHRLEGQQPDDTTARLLDTVMA